MLAALLQAPELDATFHVPVRVHEGLWKKVRVALRWYHEVVNLPVVANGYAVTGVRRGRKTINPRRV